MKKTIDGFLVVESQADLEAAFAADAGARVEIGGSLEVSLSLPGSINAIIRLKASAKLKVSAFLGCVVARESSHVVAWESSHVVARGSSHVEAWESSHVVARGSSHVEARGSSHVVARESSHVEAWESSHVEARGSSHVEAWGNVFVRLFSALKLKASAHVAIMMHGAAIEIDGGRQMPALKPANAVEWCDFYGVPVSDGIAVLYKAVGDDFRSPRGGDYTPGTVPVAPDWDGGVRECGGGLHFSPTPKMAKYGYNAAATKFVACPLALADIAVHPRPEYPDKIKARGCCAAVWEVDEDGNRVDAKVAA